MSYLLLVFVLARLRGVALVIVTNLPSSIKFWLLRGLEDFMILTIICWPVPLCMNLDLQENFAVSSELVDSGSHFEN